MRTRDVLRFVKKIEISVYPCTLYIVIADSVKLKEIRNSPYFLAKFGREDRDYLAQCSSHGSNFGIFLPNYICYNVIAHEAFHATERMLKRCNVPFENEAAAFLHGYIVELIIKEYKEKGISAQGNYI